MRDESHQVLVQAVGEMEEGGLWRSKGTPDMTGQGGDLKYWSWPNFK